MQRFFSFYGGKHGMAKRFGKPRHDHVIEPFAGSAGYSTYWEPTRVTLVERDPVLAGIWRYLIRVSPQELLRLPAEVREVDELHGVCQEAKWLIGFWLNHGLATPAKRPSNWARTKGQGKFAPLEQEWEGFWGAAVRQRLAAQVVRIRHWKIIEGNWSKAPDIEAHWHIDPPYAAAGKFYKYNNVDFTALAKWCRERHGFVQVCENYGAATWLQFSKYHEVGGANTGGNRKGRNYEAMFQQGAYWFDAHGLLEIQHNGGQQMAAHKIEKELCDALELKPAGKDRQKWLEGAAQAVKALDDDDWRRLSTPAQKWYNAADEALEKGQDIPDFAEDDESEVDEAGDEAAEDMGAVVEAEEAEEVEPAKPKKDKEVKAMPRKVTSNKKDGKAEEKTARAARKTAPPAAKRRAARGSDEGAPSMIQSALIKNPQITKAEMMEQLERKGNRASAVTVSSHLSINKSMLRKLKEAGHLKGLSI